MVCKLQRRRQNETNRSCRRKRNKKREISAGFSVPSSRKKQLVYFFSFLANSQSQLNYQGYPGKRYGGVVLLNSLSPTVLNSHCPQPYERIYIPYRFNSHSLVITPSNQTRCQDIASEFPLEGFPFAFLLATPWRRKGGGSASLGSFRAPPWHRRRPRLTSHGAQPPLLPRMNTARSRRQIGRASCRERV